MNKRDEAGLAKLIEDLKGQRLFASAVRDGLRLITDLRAGRTDVLLELFPLIGQQVARTGQGDPLLQAQIARLEALLLAQGTAPLDRAQNLLAGRTEARIGVLATPCKVGTNAVAENFLNSMKGFAGALF